MFVFLVSSVATGCCSTVNMHLLPESLLKSHAPVRLVSIRAVSVRFPIGSRSLICPGVMGCNGRSVTDPYRGSHHVTKVPLMGRLSPICKQTHRAGWTNGERGQRERPVQPPGSVTAAHSVCFGCAAVAQRSCRRSANLFDTCTNEPMAALFIYVRVSLCL